MANQLRMPEWLRYVLSHLESFIEDCILVSRYLLLPLYLALMGDIAIIGLDFFRVLTATSNETDLTAHTMQALKLLDFTMIANLIWFISAGSHYVFVHPYPDSSNKKKPRSLAHISTGILKEKMAGSIVGVSSVLLLQWFLDLAQKTDLSSIEKVAMAVVLHVAFIAGLLAFNYTNKADHHAHSQEKEGESHVENQH
jgi:uncharacterized protein (TIGR00645 family)